MVRWIEDDAEAEAKKCATPEEVRKGWRNYRWKSKSWQLTMNKLNCWLTIKTNFSNSDKMSLFLMAEQNNWRLFKMNEWWNANDIMRLSTSLMIWGNWESLKRHGQRKIWPASLAHFSDGTGTQPRENQPSHNKQCRKTAGRLHKWVVVRYTSHWQQMHSKCVDQMLPVSQLRHSLHRMNGFESLKEGTSRAATQNLWLVLFINLLHFWKLMTGIQDLHKQEVLHEPSMSTVLTNYS